MMNGDELNRNKNRRKTEQRKLPKINLDISKIKNSKMKLSISPRRKKKSIHGKNNPINLIKKVYNHKSQKQLLSSLIQKDISFQAPVLRRNSLLLPFGKIDNNSLEYKRFSQESLQNKATKFLQKYNNKINGENTMNRNSVGNYKIPTNNYKLNQIEHSIKNKINNMKIQIEKQVKITQNKNTINTEIQKRKLESSPKLLFIFKKKEMKKDNKTKKLESSLLMKETHLNDYSFKKCYKKKRSRSVDISEKAKKKLLQKLKNNMLTKTKTIAFQKINCIESEDSDANENYKGFALLPTSNIIFTFDLLLIFADLYTFIFLPLTVAQNKDLREKGHIIQEIIQYIIDLVFFLDFIISFFRGYYDYEMKIVRNNKLIINSYLKQYFCIDFIQAIPLYTIMRIFMKANKLLYLGYSKTELTTITFLLFISISIYVKIKKIFFMY